MIGAPLPVTLKTESIELSKKFILASYKAVVTIQTTPIVSRMNFVYSCPKAVFCYLMIL